MGLFSLLLLPTHTHTQNLCVYLDAYLNVIVLYRNSGNANFRISLRRRASDLPNYTSSRELCSGNYNRYWLLYVQRDVRRDVSHSSWSTRVFGSRITVRETNAVLGREFYDSCAVITALFKSPSRRYHGPHWS